MPLSAVSRNAAVAAFGSSAGFLSLHSSIPGDAGANELSGGTPAYARKAATWNFPADGVVSLAAGVTFDVAAGSMVAYVGAWTTLTAGQFLGWAPINGGAVHAPGYNRMTTKDVLAPNHGLQVGDRVALNAQAGGALPTGLSDLALYFVVARTTDTFQIALTAFSVPIITGSNGPLWWQRVSVDVFSSQGTEQVGSLSFTVGA